MSTASQFIGGLSHPSKMPGNAFGFSPNKCMTGSKLRKIPGSVCSDCYACKGMYTFKAVKLAHAKRFRKLQRALLEPDYRSRYIHAFARVINRQRVPYFRWHDAGDLQSVEHLALIVEIARRTPSINHWLPTREYKIVQNYLKLWTIPQNLNIRLSAHMIGETIPVVTLGCTSSAVASELGYQCPARRQGNQCGDCRACWDKAVPLVTYAHH